VGRGVDEEPISNSWHDEGCDSASTGASNDSWHQGSEIEESDGEELHYECEQCRLMPQDDAKCTIPKCEKCILEGEQQYGVVCMELQDGQSDAESSWYSLSDGVSEWECGGYCMRCNLQSQNEFCFMCTWALPQWRTKPVAVQSSPPRRGVDSRLIGAQSSPPRPGVGSRERGTVKKRKAPTPAVAQPHAVVPKRGGGKREPQQRNFLVLGQ
jgi:hypothetical protein